MPRPTKNKKQEQVSALYHLLQTSMVSNNGSFSSSVPEATPVIIEGVGPGVVDKHCLTEDCIDSNGSLNTTLKNSAVSFEKFFQNTTKIDTDALRVLRDQESALRWIKSYTSPTQINTNNDNIAKKIAKLLGETLTKSLFGENTRAGASKTSDARSNRRQRRAKKTGEPDKNRDLLDDDIDTNTETSEQKKAREKKQNSRAKKKTSPEYKAAKKSAKARAKTRLRRPSNSNARTRKIRELKNTNRQPRGFNTTLPVADPAKTRTRNSDGTETQQQQQRARPAITPSGVTSPQNQPDFPNTNNERQNQQDSTRTRNERQNQNPEKETFRNKLSRIKNGKYGGVITRTAEALGLSELLEFETDSGKQDRNREKERAKNRQRELAKNRPRDARGRFIRRGSAKVESAEIPEARPRESRAANSARQEARTPSAARRPRRKIPAIAAPSTNPIPSATIPSARATIPSGIAAPSNPIPSANTPTPRTTNIPSGIPSTRATTPSGIPTPRTTNIPSGIPSPAPVPIPERTISGASKLLSGAKIGGLLTVASAIPDAINIAQIASSDSSKKEKVEQIAPVGGSIVGGLAGAAVGGKAGAIAGGSIGAIFGGVGAVPGAMVGGLLGSIIGGMAGTELGTGIGKAVGTKINEEVDTELSAVAQTPANTSVEKISESKLKELDKEKVAESSSPAPATIASTSTTNIIGQTTKLIPAVSSAAAAGAALATESNTSAPIIITAGKETPTSSSLLGHSTVNPAAVEANLSNKISESPFGFSKLEQKAAKKEDFLAALATMQSNSNYTADNGEAHGAYQLGNSALIDSGYKNKDGSWSGKNGANSVEGFIKNPALQDTAAADLMRKNWANLNAKPIKQKDGYDVFAKDMVGTNVNGIKITESGLLGAAHIGGAGSVRKMLSTDGQQMPVDYDGVPIIKHMQTLGGKDVSFATTQPSLVTSSLGNYSPPEDVDYKKIGTNTSVVPTMAKKSDPLIFNAAQYAADAKENKLREAVATNVAHTNITNSNIDSQTTNPASITNNSNTNSSLSNTTSGLTKSLYSTDIIGTGTEGHKAQDIRTSYSEDYKNKTYDTQEITRYAVAQTASPKDIAQLSESLRETITERSSSSQQVLGRSGSPPPLTFENVPTLLDTNIGLILINGSIL